MRRAEAQRAIDVDRLHSGRAVVTRGDVVPVAVLELRQRRAAAHAVEFHVHLLVAAVVEAQREHWSGGHWRTGTAVVAIILEAEEDTIVAVLLAKDFVVVARVAAPCGLDPCADRQAGVKGQAVPDVDAVRAGVVAMNGTGAAVGTGGACGRSDEGAIGASRRIAGGGSAGGSFVEGIPRREIGRHTGVVTTENHIGAGAIPRRFDDRLDRNAGGHGEVRAGADVHRCRCRVVEIERPAAGEAGYARGPAAESARIVADCIRRRCARGFLHPPPRYQSRRRHEWRGGIRKIPRTRRATVLPTGRPVRRVVTGRVWIHLGQARARAVGTRRPLAVTAIDHLIHFASVDVAQMQVLAAVGKSPCPRTQRSRHSIGRQQSRRTHRHH